jgi:hypothetical protein
MTTELDILQQHHASLAATRQARLSGAEAAGALKEAERAANAANAAHMAALEDAARGVEGAMERAQAAHEARMAALGRAEQATAAGEASRRVIEAEQARRLQLQEGHWSAFAGLAEQSVAKVVEAAEALREPLEEYLRAYSQTQARWNSIRPATLRRVLDHDDAAGHFRDMGRVLDDVAVPDCPIPREALDLIRSVLPRPRFLTDGITDPFSGAITHITDTPVKAA